MFLTIKAARERFPTTPTWWLDFWWVCMSLGVKSPNYAHYMSERMMNPSPHDWPIRITEHVILVAEALLSALYNEFRMFCLSPSTEKALENLPDSEAKVSGGTRNLNDLRSLDFLHNRISCRRFTEPTAFKQRCLGKVLLIGVNFPKCCISNIGIVCYLRWRIIVRFSDLIIVEAYRITTRPVYMGKRTVSIVRSI